MNKLLLYHWPICVNASGVICSNCSSMFFWKFCRTFQVSLWKEMKWGNTLWRTDVDAVHLIQNTDQQLLQWVSMLMQKQCNHFVWTSYINIIKFDENVDLVLISTCMFCCVTDGELYTATVSNFQGNEPTIYRSLGSGTPLKTENSLNWLQGKYIQTHTHTSSQGTS